MAKEIEALGIPVACVSALDGVAQSVGANRVVRGKSIVSVVGDPSLRPEEELKFREELVRRALRALGTPVAGPTVFG